MPGDALTKEEFKAALEVQAKATEQMVLIATSLREITVELKEVHSRLSNGAIKDIVQGVTENYSGIHKETVSCLLRIEEYQKDTQDMLTSDVLVKKISDTISTGTLSRIEDAIITKLPVTIIERFNNSGMAKDLDRAKWFIGIVGIAIVVATVVIRGIDTRFVAGNQDKEIQRVEKVLADHLEPPTAASGAR